MIKDYAIDPFTYAIVSGQGTLIAGDWIDMLTGATIVGPYCAWPKTEPRYFVVTTSRKQGKTIAQKLALKLIESYK